MSGDGERWHRDPVTVRPPASTANLGPGFDCLALALELRDEITASVVPSGITVAVDGEAEVPRDETNLVVRAMLAGFTAMGRQPAGVAVRCRNRIPHGRGLGSSAAAIVGGLVVARELTVGGKSLLSDEDLLHLAAGIEGHADNVAAALLGGLTAAWRETAGQLRYRAVRLARPSMPITLYLPAQTMATTTARAVLPSTVSHADAVTNLAAATLLTHALTSADSELLLAATTDTLHQPYRFAAMPASGTLVAQLRAAGWPAALSGAGPSVMVFGEVPMAAPSGFQRLVVAVADTGA